MRISHFLFQLNFYKQFLTGKTLHRDTINVLRNNSEKITWETGLNFLVFTYLHYFVLKRERKLRIEEERDTKTRNKCLYILSMNNRQMRKKEIESEEMSRS